MQTYRYVLFFLLVSCLTFSCTASDNYGKAVEQVPVQRVERMPNDPEPYKIINWKQKAIDFDTYVYDFNPDIPAGPMIWLDNSQRNVPQITFGLYTAVHG